MPAADRTAFFFSQSSFPGGEEDTPRTVTTDDNNGINVPAFAEVDPFADIQPSRRKRQVIARAGSVPESGADFARARNASAVYFFQPDYLLASTAFIPRWPTASGVSESEATDVCADTLFGSDVALNCAEYLGSSLGTAFEFCKADLQVGAVVLSVRVCVCVCVYVRVYCVWTEKLLEEKEKKNRAEEDFNTNKQVYMHYQLTTRISGCPYFRRCRRFQGGPIAHISVFVNSPLEC